MSLDSSDIKRIVFVGYYVPDSLLETIVEQGINNMSAARQELEYSILKGLSKNEHCDLRVASYVPTSSSLKVPVDSKTDDFTIYHIPIIKRNIFSWIKGMWLFMKYLYRETDKDTCILMYAVNPVFMVPLWISKLYRNLTLITICSEVPMFRRYRNTFPMKVKKSIQTFFNNRFNKYILLTEAMKEVVSVGDKPYMVMEGIASYLPSTAIKGNRKNIVMYAGGFHPDNNIKLLVDACELTDSVEECWICGSGPQQQELEGYCKHKPKIRLLGRLTHEQVLEREKKVRVLVNLRDPSNILTRYSFPSKIIEYLSSGAQVISTELAGIPNEYFDHVNCLDTLSVERLSQIIKELMTLSDNEFYKRAEAALDFLRDNKSAEVQTNRIVDFVCSQQ